MKSLPSQSKRNLITESLCSRCEHLENGFCSTYEMESSWKCPSWTRFVSFSSTKLNTFLSEAPALIPLWNKSKKQMHSDRWMNYKEDQTEAKQSSNSPPKFLWPNWAWAWVCSVLLMTNTLHHQSLHTGSGEPWQVFSSVFLGHSLCWWKDGPLWGQTEATWNEDNTCRTTTTTQNMFTLLQVFQPKYTHEHLKLPWLIEEEQLTVSL